MIGRRKTDWPSPPVVTPEQKARLREFLSQIRPVPRELTRERDDQLLRQLKRKA